MDPIFIKTWPTFGGLALARNRADTVVLFSRGRRYCAIPYGGREGAYNEPRFVTVVTVAKFGVLSAEDGTLTTLMHITYSYWTLES